MTRNQVIAVAKKAGYTRVATQAGPVPLDQWTPYGATKEDERMASVAVMGFRFVEDEQRPRIEDVIPEDTKGYIGGTWPLGKD